MEYFVQEGQKGYSEKGEDQEDQDQDKEDQEKHNINNTSKFFVNSPSYNNYGSSSCSSHNAEAINFMDLSLRNANNSDENSNDWPPSSEREHMFDKVVTPSDVGKLNRLVIPKQHAEKYFPLDSSSNEKGLLLNFLDRHGKPWRFRYSYWNSSQSYVMTKGWSRFVKDKKLDAGDIVSFQRSVRDKNVLYIDWRRRPPPPQNHHLWGAGGAARFYSFQRPPSMAMPLRHHDQTHFHNYNIHHPYHHHQYPYHQMNHYQLPPPPPQYYNGVGITPGIVIDSVPIVQHHHHHLHHQSKNINMSPGGSSSNNKRLRLFGVNMEYSPTQEDDELPEQCQILSSTVASISPHHHLPSSASVLPNYAAPLPGSAELLSQKGKSTSLSFYPDP